MKYFFFIILIFNIFLCKTIYSAESYVVLKVNNNVITNIDIDNEFRYLIALNKDLKNIPLIKQSRLSVMPIDTKSWKIILKMGSIL